MLGHSFLAARDRRFLITCEHRSPRECQPVVEQDGEGRYSYVEDLAILDYISFVIAID